MDLAFKDIAVVDTHLYIDFAIAEDLMQNGIHLALRARGETCLEVMGQEIAEKYEVKAGIDLTTEPGKFIDQGEKILNGVDIFINSSLTNEFIKYNIRVNIINATSMMKAVLNRNGDTNLLGWEYLEKVAKDNTSMNLFVMGNTG